MSLFLSFSFSLPTFSEAGRVAEFVVDIWSGWGAGDADFRKTCGVEREVDDTTVVVTTDSATFALLDEPEGVVEIDDEDVGTEGVSNSGGRF